MQTVVGVFDSATDAQMARDELIRAGFSESAVSLQSNAADGGAQDEGFMAGVGSFFRDIFGGDEKDAGDYSEALRRGGSAVAVTVEDESKVSMARSALAAAGAVNVEKRAEVWREQGYSAHDPASAPYRAEEVQADRARVLPVVREELEVGKREVDLGAVRVFSRTESRPVNETIELREQHADIDRRAVDRPATAADLKAFEGGSIEVHETAERAVVSKTARVVEEVLVGTQASTKTETISDTVRNTVVEVDKSGTGNNTGMGASQERLAGYRTHFDRNLASSGGNYEEYEPAYHYGSSLRSDPRHSNRQWSDVEADAQQDWGTRYPESGWERAKSAVQHGWDSATGGGSSSSTGSGSSLTGSGAATGTGGIAGSTGLAGSSGLAGGGAGSPSAGNFGSTGGGGLGR